MDDVKFIIIKDCSTGIGFATLNQSYSFDITEESFDKFLKKNDVNFIKLVQKSEFSNTKTVFYVNCDRIGYIINDEIYNIVIKFKKSYN